MRFTQAERHFTTKEQALAEIASVGWHALKRHFLQKVSCIGMTSMPWPMC